jgi:hypothetical protein
MLEVEVNGTTFPVYTDEVDHPYLKWFTEKKAKTSTNVNKLREQLPVEKAKQRPPKLAKGVYLSFLPVFKPDELEDIVDHIRIHLLNELPQAIQFSYDVRLLHSSLFRLEGKLHGFGNIYLHSIPYSDMNDQPRFNWRLDDLEQPEMRSAEGTVRIRPDKLFRHVADMLQKNEPSFSYLLLQEFMPLGKPEKPAKPEKIEIVKHVFTPAVSYPAVMGPSPYEIDLHIENLVADTKGLANADMLQIQLDALQQALHRAIVNRQERLMIIHGLGKGVLREEVHRILDNTPGVKKYANEWQGKYGFGATEVFFDYL